MTYLCLVEVAHTSLTQSGHVMYNKKACHPVPDRMGGPVLDRSGYLLGMHVGVLE
jgi:hypothetical protein